MLPRHNFNISVALLALLIAFSSLTFSVKAAAIVYTDLNIPKTRSLSHTILAPRSVSYMGEIDETPAETWRNYHTCHPSFFEFTRANVAQANLSSWYDAELTRVLKSNSVQLAKYEKGEVSFYGAMIGFDPNFSCSIAEKGCNYVPDCETVVEKVLIGQNYNESDDDDIMKILDEGRKAYFTARQMNEIIKYISLIMEVLDKVEDRGKSSALDIVAHFTPSPDFRAEQACLWRKTSMQLMWTMLRDIVALVVTKVDGIPAEVAPEAFMLIDTINFFTQNAINIAKNVDDKKYSDTYRQADHSEGLHMQQSYTSGICGDVGGEQKDETLARVAQMLEYITRTVSNAEKQISLLTELIFKGNKVQNGQVSEKMSRLAALLADYRIIEGMKLLKANQIQIQDQMGRRFEQHLISSAYANTHCYEKCYVGGEVIRGQCKMDLRKDNENVIDEKMHWYCPAEDLVCVAKCWTTQSSGNHEIHLPGTEQLEKKYGANLTEFIRSSYQNFGASGNLGDGLTFIQRNDILDFNKWATENSWTLPVCKTELKDFQDWRNDPPCTCGNWMSNETSSFTKAIGFAWNEADAQAGKNAEFLIQACPQTLRHQAPLTRFLAFCELGIEFPRKGQHLFSVNGGHESCKAMKEEIKKNGWELAPMKANFHFCTASATGSAVRKGEAATANVARSMWKPNEVRSHATVCGEWLKNHHFNDNTDINHIIER